MCFCVFVLLCLYLDLHFFMSYCDDIWFFVGLFVFWSGLVPLDADNLFNLYSCKVVKRGIAFKLKKMLIAGLEPTTLGS